MSIEKRPCPGAGGIGDVVGPAGSTALALARYADTTGKLLKNSGTTLSDTGLLTMAAALKLKPVTLVYDGFDFVINCAAGNVFIGTLTKSTTFKHTNCYAGFFGLLYVGQDGTGGNVESFEVSKFKSPGSSGGVRNWALSSGANEYDLMAISSKDGSFIDVLPNFNFGLIS